jgi:hypothetical protein
MYNSATFYNLHLDHLQSPNLLKTKRNVLYIRSQSVPRCKHFRHGYKNQSVSDYKSKVPTCSYIRTKHVYEYPERCNDNILVLFQDLYMFRVPAVPFIRSTILQLAVTGKTYCNIKFYVTVFYTSDCQLHYFTPDEGYSRYPKHVEILK